ncbi:MAG: hypothetical protein K2L68_04695, partial [Muribaculaceae bacterium]|nr:hypothetical protein [Muribaculaceae bacterium]
MLAAFIAVANSLLSPEISEITDPNCLIESSTAEKDFATAEKFIYLFSSFWASVTVEAKTFCNDSASVIRFLKPSLPFSILNPIDIVLFEAIFILDLFVDWFI